MTVNNRITELLAQQRGILSIFVTAGYPALGDTVPVCETLAACGVGMIELGLPFSDPIADGPVIQAANNVALGNGVTTRKVLEMLAQIRARGVALPILLMGHFNPLLQYGVAEFCRDAAAAGADGVIVPDLPPEIYLAEYREMFERHNLSVVFLVTSATPDERVRQIDEAGSGFIYAVSLAGVTGSKLALDTERRAYLERLARLQLRNPVLVGFGVETRQQFDGINQLAHGAIVGSAFIKALTDAPDVRTATRAFVSRFL